MARQLALNVPAASAGARPSRNQLLDADRPVHDWYRFVLSFPPHLVRDYLAEFRAGPGSVVLDPFCGTGTTPVEAKKLGISSIGIEALPLSAFAARTKLDWYADPGELRRAADAAARRAAASEAGPLRTLPEAQMRLLPDRAISPPPLHKALCLRDAIAEAPERLRAHLLLALAKNLPTRIGNLRFGPEIGLGAIREDADVIGEWRSAVAEFADDLELVGSGTATPASVIRGDAREAGDLLEPHSIDAVITSPPYPNEKDYTRAVRLESVILGFAETRAALRETKQTLVRSNSRGVYKTDDEDAWLADHPGILALADRIEQRRIALNKTSGFERQYHRVAKLYFGGMARHLASLRKSLRPGAQLAYVVGDQASYFQIMIRTSQLLSEIAENLGYEIIRRDLFRTRKATATKSDINEDVLILRWRG